ncbi:MAG: sensor histidine kinase [Phycisphaerales bacterium]
MATLRLSPVRSSPLAVLLVILLVAFVVEGAVMAVLPLLGPWPRPSLGETLTDACLLTLGLVPAVWFLVVRPLREMHRARGELLRLVFEAQEAERRRLGRDLHDELGQSLTALVVMLRAQADSAETPTARERGEELAGLAAATLDQVRRLSRGVRPEVLEDFGLGVAVERLVEDFRAAHPIEAEASIELPAEVRVPGLVSLAAYRIIQEALTNVARHSRAKRVRVAIRTTPDGVLALSVADDGVGLAPGDGVRPSLGVRSMRERAELLSGSFTLRHQGHSGSRGTTVEARIPLSPEVEA